MQEDFYEAIDRDDVYEAISLTSQQKQAFGSAGDFPIWYWPQKDRRAVEVTLQGKPDGTFVIRDSQTSKNDFVLSVSECNRVSHYIIQRTGPKSFVLSNKTFTDLPSLLDFYKIHILADSVLCRPLPARDALESGKLVSFFLERVKTKYNFNARDSEDLAFRKSEELNIIEKHEPEWWKAQHPETLEIGCIPSNYVDYLYDGPRGKHIKEQARLARERAEREAREARERAMKPPPPTPDQLQREEEERQRQAAREAEARLEEARRVEAELKEREERRMQEAEEQRIREEERRLQEETEQRKAEAARAKEKAKGTYKPPERPKFVVAKAIISRFANVFDKSALTFKCGDLIHVRKQHENGLWDGSVMEGKRCGRKGHFPFTFVDLMDSAAFDDDVKQVAVAFQVAELKKQGVDVNKLVKKGVEAPPALPKREPVPAPVSAPPAPEDDDMYEAPDEDVAASAPAPNIPSRTYNKAPPPLPSTNTRGPPPPLPPTSYEDDDYGMVDEQEEMIYGMAGDFDQNAVEAMMEDIYGTA